MKKFNIILILTFVITLGFSTETFEELCKKYDNKNISQKDYEFLFDIADSIYFEDIENYKPALDKLQILLSKHENSYYQYYYYESLLYYYGSIKDSLNLSNTIKIYNDYFTKIKTDSLMGSYYYMNGYYNYKTNNFFTAIDFYEKASEKFNEYSKLESVASVKNFIGRIYYDLEIYDKALLYYLKSINTYNELGLPDENLDNFESVALIYQEIKNYDSAINYYQKAYDIAIKENNVSFASEMLNSLGITYFDKEDFEMAINFLEKSISLAPEDLDATDQAIKFNNIGISFIRLNNLDKAEIYLKRALSLFTVKDSLSKENTNLNLAEIYLKQNKLSKAEKLINNAFKIVNNNSPLFYLKALQHKATLGEKKGDFKQAYFAINEYNKLFKELSDNELRLKVNDIKNKYEIEKKDKEIELLRKTEEINEFEISRIKYIRNTLFIGSFIILIFLIYTVYKFRQNLKLNKLLLKQKSDLEKSYNEIKKAQENIIMLERKNSILAMVVTANHELNQPLMILRSNFDMLNFSTEKPWNPNQERYVNQIEKSLDRINAILQKYRDNQNMHLGEYAGEDQMVIFD